jgi:hypothetical protein
MESKLLGFEREWSQRSRIHAVPTTNLPVQGSDGLPDRVTRNLGWAAGGGVLMLGIPAGRSSAPKAA